ncbi:MAG: tetratricopeptide repeat protein [Terriglobales bacterium]
MVLFTASVVQAQPDLGTLQGSVFDSRGRPVAGATVYVQLKDETQTLTAIADSTGNYRFPGLRAGVYTLHAEMSGYENATHDPICLGPKDTKRIDLTLGSAKAKGAQSSAAGTSTTGRPEFFDEPAFTVAGVTDTTNLGGHGSNTIVRSKESLAREAAALSKEPTPSPSSVAEPEKSLRDAAERKPENFEANQRLGKLLVSESKSSEAIPYLQRAARLHAGDYENTYLLARAYTDAARYDDARSTARTLLSVPGKSVQQEAEIYHLLGDVAEKQGNPLEAVRDYQRAAELNPSESNLFDWGAELLLHHAAEPAVEVFTKGSRLHPRSGRMLVGLGVAWYARGSYEQAAQNLCQASDLNPDDPNPYLFMGKMQVTGAQIMGAQSPGGQSTGTSQPDCVTDRLKRFAGLQPDNALANYYYALSLSKRLQGPEDTQTMAQVESHLEKSIRLDPKLGAAYVQLGVLYSDRKEFPQAISSYQKAIDASPGSEEAHYRLAQVYRRTGEKLKAQQELQLYQQISKKKEEEVERQRHEIQQFVYTLRDSTSASHSPE